MASKVSIGRERPREPRAAGYSSVCPRPSPGQALGPSPDGRHRALRPSGRFVAEMGGHNNTAAIMVALCAVLGRYGLDARRLNPWHFPSAAAWRGRLEAAGFIVDEIRIIPRPTPLPAGLEGWLDTFAEDFLGALPAADRPAAQAEIVGLLCPVLVDETGMWIADYVRLRFRASRPK